MRSALPCALLLACTAPSAGRAVAPLLEGTPDPNEAAVVGLVWRGPDYLFCTGTLIAPRVVVTSAHCVRDLRPDELSVRVVAGGASSDVDVALVRTHPAYDGFLDDADVALVFLATELATTPVPLRSAPLGADARGATLRLAGFGMTAPGARAGEERNQGTAVLTDYDDMRFGLRPAPSVACFGDSGGPAFLTQGGVEQLAGLSLRGDCASFATCTRVDPYVAEFLAPGIASAAPGGAGAGERCYDARQCRPGLTCRSGAGGLAFCAGLCGAPADCPAGLVCSGGACLWPEPAPGMLGGSCRFTSDCAQGVCGRSPTALRGSCVLEEGCAAAGGGGGFVAALAILVVLFLRSRFGPARR